MFLGKRKMYKKKPAYTAKKNDKLINTIDKEIKKFEKKNVETKQFSYGDLIPYSYQTLSTYLWEAVGVFAPVSMATGTKEGERIGLKVKVKYIDVVLEYVFQGYAGYNAQRSRLIIFQLKPNCTQAEIEAQLDYNPPADVLYGDTMSLLDWPDLVNKAYILKDMIFDTIPEMVRTTDGGAGSVTETLPISYKRHFTVYPKIQPKWDELDVANPSQQGDIIMLHFSEGLGGGTPATVSTPKIKCQTSTYYTDQ